MPGVGKLIKEAQKMQAKVQQMQEALAKQSFNASAAGGSVLVTVNGRGEITALTLDDEFLKEDPATISQTIVGAINQAQKAATDASESQMSAISSPLKGIFG